MKIRVVVFGKHYLEFENVTNFDPDVQGFLMIDEADGDTVFFNKDKIEFFRVIDE